MRSVIQRVSHASVSVGNETIAEIGIGLVVLLGIEEDDTFEDIEWLSGKIHRLRIFNDAEGVMNISVAEQGGEIMVISQFTLFGSTKKGNRPSYIRAAQPAFARNMFDKFVNHLKQVSGTRVKTGIFGADMQIELVNDGPVTLIIDTKKKE